MNVTEFNKFTRTSVSPWPSI